MPDMFPQPSNTNDGTVLLKERLMAGIDNVHGLPSEFVEAMATRFDGDGLESIFGPPLVSISQKLTKMNILDDFLAPMRVLAQITLFKPIAKILPLLDEFDPDNTVANNIELLSLLGPFFRLSGFPDVAPKVAESYFKNPELRTNADIVSTINTVRSTVHNIRISIHQVMNNLVRVSPETRQQLINYLQHIVHLNLKRAQMRVDKTQVSSDGLLSNITQALLNLCDPFLDFRASKINKVEIDHIFSSDWLNLKEETLLNAAKPESDEFFEKKLSEKKDSNFITQIFTLTLAYLHYGPIKSFSDYQEQVKACADFKQELEDYERNQLNDPVNGPMANIILQRGKNKLTSMESNKLAMEAMVLDSEFLSHIMRFYNFVMSWMVRLVDPKGKHPWETVSLPLPKDVPEQFAMLPEWIVQDIVDFFTFLGKNAYHLRILKSNSQAELITFIITFLSNGQYIKNPYLKAKLVEILFYFTYPIAQGVPGDLEDALHSQQMALKYLMPAMLNFYADVEQTGASSQFYDKFNIRYNISEVMKNLWNNQSHRESLRRSTENQELFIQFANMLMSDVTYLLDESLTRLTEIKGLEEELEHPSPELAANPQLLRERQATLTGNERQAKFYVSMGNSTVHMLEYLTKEIPEPFMAGEIVDRLAAMLDYNLSQLVGPKCTELKVKNREKYHFAPRTLLAEIIDIYINLNSETFVRAVSRDERSYKKSYFSRAASILLKHGLKYKDDIADLEQFVNKVEIARQEEHEEEDELGDIPDEFIDPILSHLMEDPVVLPTSGMIVDRSTIRAHLLGDKRDPFSRAPLTMDMVKPGKTSSH
ncbi:ubiquitin elongating factor core-domain-containing protein [Umbelopsis sp. PMI_123]|nr:ubiquitin elongating factor core-domain-containing protein [Umbelopsis sp. PMI_123]